MVDLSKWANPFISRPSRPPAALRHLGETLAAPLLLNALSRGGERQPVRHRHAHERHTGQAVCRGREHACDGINVPRVVSAAAISRSGLETKVLGYTIRAAIRRTQLDRARQLVSETDMPLKQVASDTGFKSVQHMTTLFVKAFGDTPAKRRRASGP